MGLEKNFKSSEINPIAEGANRIRANTRELVCQDLGFFPRDYQYGHGDYNVVFVIVKGYGEQGGGFFRKAHMVVLTPNGDFQSGFVRQDVGRWSSVWEFRVAELEPAKDLEVVRYTPRLLLNLFEHTRHELPDQDDPIKIEKTLKLLSKAPEVFVSVTALSQQSLREMGEGEVDGISIGESDYNQAATRVIREFIAEHKTEKNPSLEEMKAAFNLYQNREILLRELTSLAANMRASPVEEWFAQHVRKLVEQGIFPGNIRDNEETWYLTGSGKLNSEVYHNEHEGRWWVWDISSKGKVREVTKFATEFITRQCPEHLLEDARGIANRLIAATVEKHFPKLK